MIYLTVEEILILHQFQIESFGGSDGVRDISLLESAVLRPQATFGGKDLYADMYTKAAVLTHSLISNHPFVDGNKRTGLHSTLTFLEINGYATDFTQADLVELGVAIASKHLNVEKIAKKFKVNAVSG